MADPLIQFNPAFAPSDTVADLVRDVSPARPELLSTGEAAALLATASVERDLAPERIRRLLDESRNALGSLRPAFEQLAEQRCQHLVEAQERFSNLAEKKRFGVV